MSKSLRENFEPRQPVLVFPFGDAVLLPDQPMTDEEFNQYVLSDNNEIPIEKVHFVAPALKK